MVKVYKTAYGDFLSLEDFKAWLKLNAFLDDDIQDIIKNYTPQIQEQHKKAFFNSRNKIFEKLEKK